MRINNPRQMITLPVITIIAGAADIFYCRPVNTECTHSVQYTALNLVLSDISSIRMLDVSIDYDKHFCCKTQNIWMKNYLSCCGEPSRCRQADK